MKPLQDSEVEARLEKFEGWSFNENAIHTKLEFENFKEAFAAMTRIAFEAEALQHHPEWFNVYNNLEISLSTHDAQGVTNKDFELAERIEKIISA
jgi:4a-hydroxytetrahydrobiopterin dehydratase